jgi:mannonate dehydratase
MYISEQLISPDARRLRLSAQLGVQHVVLDNRGSELVSAASGGITAWDAARLRDYRRWVEGFGLTWTAPARAARCWPATWPWRQRPASAA